MSAGRIGACGPGRTVLLAGHATVGLGTFSAGWRTSLRSSQRRAPLEGGEGGTVSPPPALDRRPALRLRPAAQELGDLVFQDLVDELLDPPRTICSSVSHRSLDFHLLPRVASLMRRRAFPGVSSSDRVSDVTD